MELSNEQIGKQIARKSAMIYLPISLGAALLFVVLSSTTGQYPLVARVGGMIWVGLLSLIVTMPLVISKIKKHYKDQQG